MSRTIGMSAIAFGMLTEQNKYEHSVEGKDSKGEAKSIRRHDAKHKKLTRI